MLRRAFRIYPLSMLVVLVTFAFRMPAAEIGHATLHTIPVGVGGLIANLLLVQNLTFTPSIIGPLWSLPLEVQMYLFLPSLFLFVRRDMSVRPLLGLWAIAVVLGLLQPLVSDRLTIVSFIPSFFPGIIAYRLSATTWPRWPSYLWPICLAAVATLFVLSRPDLHGWVPCLLTGLAIPRFKEVSLVWVRRAAHLIARYSYGIYLTHVFALWLAFIGLAGLPAEVRWVIFLSALVGLPVLLYHSVEAPLLRYGARLAD